MNLFFNFFTYSFLFLAVYFQVFLLITLLDHNARIESARNRAKKKYIELNLEQDYTLVDTQGNKNYASFIESYKTIGALDTSDPFDFKRTYPAVTILVPVFNEERTVEKTIDSLLELEYPKDKLQIMVVDDGSTDNTWKLIQKFKEHSQITLHQKENGGKYTALNYGITHCTNEFIGCLDADSFVDSKALLHIIPHFDNPEIVAVTPSMKIQNPDTLLGMIQNAEYNMGIYTRKIFALLDAQYVTPGPFSIFKKTVFEEVGLYKHAHNTEDLEMALRLQARHYRIENADKAIVYTVGPRTLYKLYRQRVRWTGGFIQNTLDYRKMILNPKYGNLGLLVLPLMMYAIMTTLFFLFYTVYNTAKGLMASYQTAQIIGWKFSFDSLSLESIAYSLRAPVLIGIIVSGMIIFAIWYGKKIAGVQDKKMLDIVYFLLLYSLISPLWLITSVYNTIRQRDAVWR